MQQGFGARHRATLLAGIGLAALGSAGTAQAAGYALLEQSAVYEGASYAGSAARADDPSTLFYNPAGMTQLPGYQFSMSGAFIDPQAYLKSGSATTLAGTDAGGTVGHNAGESVLLPSFYATAQVAPDWHVGLAVTSPFGLATKYGFDSVTRYNALTTSLATYNFAPSVAWQVLPTLSIAAGLHVEVADARLSQAVDFGSIGYGKGLGGYGYLPGSHDGVTQLKGNNTAVGWQTGLLWQPLPGTNVGFDYRSPIFHTLSGSVSFQNAGVLAPAFTGGPATAKLVTPDTFSLSLAQQAGRFTLLAGIDYTLWSRFRDLEINYVGGPSPAILQEHWNNSMMFSAGADYRLTETVTLRSGAAVDLTPVTNAYRNALIPDSNRYWLSVGATWKPEPHLALSAAYSHLFMDSAKISLAGEPGISTGLLANYNNQINIFSMEGTLSF